MYDIRDPKRWRRAYRVIRGYGQRLQYSIFRVSGTELQIARLRWELQRVLAPEDALLVIRLCPGCPRACAPTTTKMIGQPMRLRTRWWAAAFDGTGNFGFRDLVEVLKRVHGR
jgi:CRISPR-associated endonuclease Cas2